MYQIISAREKMHFYSTTQEPKSGENNSTSAKKADNAKTTKQNRQNSTHRTNHGLYEPTLMTQPSASNLRWECLDLMNNGIVAHDPWFTPIISNEVLIRPTFAKIIFSLSKQRPAKHTKKTRAPPILRKTYWRTKDKSKNNVQRTQNLSEEPEKKYSTYRT